MSLPVHQGRRLPPHGTSQVQLMLRFPDGARWSLTVSKGMERFIGHYPRIAGLGSGGPLLRYERVRRDRGS